MIGRSAMLAAALTLCCPVLVFGQGSRRIQLGASVSGTLSSTSDRLSDGRYHNDYDYPGAAGERLRISLTGSGFDPEIVLYRCAADCVEVGRDDDGGDGLNSLLEVTLPSSGDYVVVVLAHSANSTGTYTLSLARGTSSSASPTTSSSPSPTVGSQTLTVGVTAYGRLEPGDQTMGDSSYKDYWSFQALAGERYHVRMQSQGFDPYFTVSGTGRSGSNGFAELEVTIQNSGAQEIMANSSGAGAKTGSYTLQVTNLGAGFSGGASSTSPASVSGFAAGRLSFGVTASGSLAPGDSVWTDNTYFDWWTFEGSPGQRVRIRMTGSSIRPYFSIGKLSGGRFDYMKGSETVDGAAQLDITLEAGTYLIRANHFGSSPQPGTYTLTLTRN